MLVCFFSCLFRQHCQWCGESLVPPSASPSSVQSMPLPIQSPPSPTPLYFSATIVSSLTHSPAPSHLSLTSSFSVEVTGQWLVTPHQYTKSPPPCPSPTHEKKTMFHHQHPLSLLQKTRSLKQIQHLIMGTKRKEKLKQTKG